MKSGNIGFVALGLVLLVGTYLQAQPRGRGDADAAKNGWILDLDDGVAQAEKSGKPLMVVFRCGP